MNLNIRASIYDNYVKVLTWAFEAINGLSVVCSYRVLSYKKLCMETLRALFQLAKVKPPGLHIYTLHIDKQLEIIKPHC